MVVCGVFIAVLILYSFVDSIVLYCALRSHVGCSLFKQSFHVGCSLFVNNIFTLVLVFLNNLFTLGVVSLNMNQGPAAQAVIN